jgi:hypothetical protein
MGYKQRRSVHYDAHFCRAEASTANDLATGEKRFKRVAVFFASGLAPRHILRSP